ncbi:MAG: hypothetical protein ACRDS9_23490 [Pseudonocardiaceae bacterium]
MTAEETYPTRRNRRHEPDGRPEQRRVCVKVETGMVHIRKIVYDSVCLPERWARAWPGTRATARAPVRIVAPCHSQCGSVSYGSG